MNTHSSSVRGFTLIELMVVITIIGLLASSVLVALGNARAKARDARRTADVRQVMTALELYANDNGQYPLQATPVNFSVLAGALVPGYLDKMPIDPRGGTEAAGAAVGSYNLVYESDVNHQGYAIYTKYERSTLALGPASGDDIGCVRGVNVNGTIATTLGSGASDRLPCK